MVGVMVLNALRTKGFDTGHGCTEIDEGLAIVFDA